MTKMKDFKIDENGSVYDQDGAPICSIGELSAAFGQAVEGYTDQKPHYSPDTAVSELFLRRATSFELPPEKIKLQNGIWSFFSCGIHKTMANVSSQQQKKRSFELNHSIILTSLIDPEISEEMSVSDYIQLHALGEDLVSRGTTFEGDRYRDATIFGANINPDFVDVMKYNTESPKNGGFFSHWKKKR